MILTSSGDSPGRVPGHLMLAAVDVEWTKNTRIRDGNVPFCYSAAWLAVPAGGMTITPGQVRFAYISAYTASTAETRELVSSAGATLAQVLDGADLICGHQLCSDLAVLARTAGQPPQAVSELHAAWRQRRLPADGRPRVTDTRYDTGHVLSGTSRRLVDVCADLHLDVTQPELRGTSMTALHRRWLELADATAREKITVLNLRHSLSTALVAARAAGLAHWQPGLNLNQVLASELGSTFGWTSHPVFKALLGESGAA
jgi:hypothetical protein